MKTILVVDDEPRIIEIIKAYLEKEGYRVTVALDGKSALERARSERPNLIVLDLMLPNISGWDVCRTLRKDSDVPHHHAYRKRRRHRQDSRTRAWRR